MLYKKLLKLKKDTHNIIDLEATHWYLRLLEGTPTLHAQVFVEFGNLYTLLDVYNISKKLEQVHAHYEASTMRPPSCLRLQPPPAAPTRSSHSSSRAKVLHSTPPILPSCNYYNNLTHKASEHSFGGYLLWLLWERGTSGSCLFCQVPETEIILIITTKSTNIFCCPSTKSQGTLALHSSFPHQG